MKPLLPNLNTLPSHAAEQDWLRRFFEAPEGEEPRIFGPEALEQAKAAHAEQQLRGMHLVADVRTRVPVKGVKEGNVIRIYGSRLFGCAFGAVASNAAVLASGKQALREAYARVMESNVEPHRYAGATRGKKRRPKS